MNNETDITEFTTDNSLCCKIACFVILIFILICWFFAKKDKNVESVNQNRGWIPDFKSRKT